MHTLAAPTLAAALWPARGARTDIFRAAILAFAGSVFLAISAKFQIPFWPVPFTLQTFVVSILGMVYGRKLAVAAVLLYLGEGAVGLPVFAGGGGLAYFAGPTAGYLLAFLPAAFLLGWLAERGWGRGFVATFAAMTMGAALVFAVGVSWLGYAIGFEKAVAVGLLPFIPSEAIKIVAAALLLPACWRRFGRGAPRGESESESE